MKTYAFRDGAMRVVDIPGLGSYDIVTGLGYTSGDYGKSAWAYSCINLRANALAQIPWRLTRNDKVVEKHPLIELLTTFGSESVKATEIDMLLRGFACWLKDGDRLVRLNPNTMKVKTSKTGIIGFVQTIDGKDQPMFAPEEIVYFREFHPTDDLGPGVAAIEVAKNAILAEYESQRYVKAFFENDAIPGLLIRTEQTVPQPEMTKLKAWWEATFKGAKKHHKVGFVDKGLEAQILTTDLRAMALTEIRDQARRDICTALQVPMVLVGSMDEATYANAQEARKFMMVEVTLPRADYFADVINDQLVQAIDPSVRFEWAIDELEILQEDKDAKATRLIALKNAGIVDESFVREEMGIPETAAPKAAPVSDIGNDMNLWQKKALKALNAGKSANCAFETDQVTPALQAAIRVQLDFAKTPEEVKRVFLQR